jgi:hypothetical protein
VKRGRKERMKAILKETLPLSEKCLNIIKIYLPLEQMLKHLLRQKKKKKKKKTFTE